MKIPLNIEDLEVPPRDPPHQAICESHRCAGGPPGSPAGYDWGFPMSYDELLFVMVCGSHLKIFHIYIYIAMGHGHVEWQIIYELTMFIHFP